MVEVGVVVVPVPVPVGALRPLPGRREVRNVRRVRGARRCDRRGWEIRDRPRADLVHEQGFGSWQAQKTETGVLGIDGGIVACREGLRLA